MPAYPNPYGPATQIGSGLQNISQAIFNYGRSGMAGRYARARSDAQEAEDMAQAELHKARVREFDQKSIEQERRNAALAPEALSRYGADAAGVSQQIYDNVNELPQGEGMQGPYAAYGYSPETMNAVRIGRMLSQHFAANDNPNPEQFAKAAGVQQRNQYLADAVNGLISTDAFGDAVSAAEGKPRYGLEGGIQFSNQVGGRTSMTPLGTAKVAEVNANISGKAAQAGADNARARLANVQADAGGFAPRAEPKGTTPKRVSLTKAEAAAMENQLADLVGTEFKKIDSQSRAAFISRATELTVDPASNFHRNPAGAMQAAVTELAPEGFEDSAGMFSSARFIPKGGVRQPRQQPAMPQATPRKVSTGGGGGLPAQARSALREGVHTKFANGQTWTLQGGAPVQVQ